MRKLMDSLDMTGNEIINVSMQKITSLPSDNLFTGRLIYLESESEETPSGYYYYNGEEWVSIGNGEGGGSNNTIDHTKINVIENEFEVNKFDTISDARTYIKSKEGDSGDVYSTGFIIIIGNDTGLTSIDNYAFDRCFSIKSVYIPKSITSIGNFAFRNNITLKYVNMNHGITSIGNNAFRECASLINIDIPNSVNSIGEDAFAYCTGLTSVNITRGSLKSAAFSYCTGLTSVILGGDVIVTNNDYAIFSGCTSLQNVYLKNGYTYIGGSMFRDCTSLQNIYIPDSVKTIDTTAFSNCTSLTNITIPEGVKTFGYSILSSCTSLRKVTIPSTVTTIPDNPVSYCTNLEILEWKTTSVPNSGGLFYNYTKLRYVEISASSILVNMFCNCTSLTTVKINNSVKTIGTTAFSGCTSLTNITIPYGVTSIDVSAFYGCKSLTNIIIPSSVTGIGNAAFNSCTSLTNITIPSGVTSIGAAAFAYCTGLTSITIPNSVTRIGDGAFGGCTSLKSITIPSSVTRIDNGAFDGCTSLTNVSIPGRFINTNLFDIIPSTIDYLTVTSGSNSGNTSFPAIFKDNPYIKNIVINSHSGILNIVDTAFQNCTSLTSVTIPNSVTSIGNNAFSGCTSLTSVTIPNSVTSIGGGAFIGCTSLKSVTIDNNGAISIGSAAFSNCTSLKSISIPSSVTSIDYGAFGGCTSLKIVTINANTTNIKSGTFSDCTALESVSIGNYITTIESSAFYNCTSLKSITIPNSVTIISPAAFSNSSLERITINNTDNIINISGNAFAGLDLLSSVTIKGNAILGSNVFAGCSNLKNVQIDEITEIGNGMFAGCNNLSYISMKKVTTIRGGAFSGCTSLKSISIPNTVTSIDSVAFTGCDIMALEPYKDREGYPWGATSIYIQNEDVTTTINENSTDRQVPTAKAVYSKISIDQSKINVIDDEITLHTFDTLSDAKTYINSNNKPKSVVIGSNAGVTSIGSRAFYNCKSLASINIPSNVTSILDDAFENCTSLTSIDMSNGVTSIGRDAFYNCKSLKFITIPSSVTSISDDAFFGCKSLEYVTIPESVKSIGGGAFAECTSLKSINIPYGIKYIYNSTFTNCASLTYISISNTVTSIDNYVFEGCKSLESITIPSSVTSINGRDVFRNCTSLKSIIIPSSVTSIDSGAFRGCDILALEPYKDRTGYPWGATNIFIQNEDVTTTIDENSTDRQVPTAKAVNNSIEAVLSSSGMPVIEMEFEAVTGQDKYTAIFPEDEKPILEDTKPFAIKDTNNYITIDGYIILTYKEYGSDTTVIYFANMNNTLYVFTINIETLEVECASNVIFKEEYNAGKTLEKGTKYVINGKTYTVADNAEIFNDYVNNIATGEYSRAEGKSTIATGSFSHAEGRSTIASGHYSHAEGYNTIAEGNYSHSEGYGTICGSPYQHVQGKYNIQDNNSKYAYILGNGTDNNNRSNAIAIGWDGKIYMNNSETGADVSAHDNALIELIDSGQKNLLKNQETSREINGVTFTILSDGSVQLSGTASDDITTYRIVSEAPILSGDMVLSGCPSGGADNTYKIDILNGLGGGILANDYGSGAVIDWSKFTAGTFTVRIRIQQGTNVDGLIFKPMICSKAAWNISQKYVHYRPSYDELITRIVALENA